MVSVSLTASSGKAAALAILRYDAVTAQRKADVMSANTRLARAIIAEFGGGPKGGLWLPDGVIRSTAIGTNGRAYFTGRHSAVSATSGDDWVNADEDSIVDGGEGNDVITLREGGAAYGGAGEDYLCGSNSYLFGGAGNDEVKILNGGEGNGGKGYDLVSAYYGGKGYGEEGDDTMEAGSGSTVYGGVGNDQLFGRGKGNRLSGDEGDDDIDLTNAIQSTVIYRRGDGRDTITVGAESREAIEAKNGENTLALCEINESDATIEMNGDEATIRFAGTKGDSIRIRFTDDTALKISFQDGTIRTLSRQAQGGRVAQVNAAYKSV